MEVQQEAVYCVGGLLALIELVGVREQVSLEPARVAGSRPLQEGVVVGIFRCRLVKLLDRANSVFLKSLKDFLHREALGEGHGRSSHAGRTSLHIGYKGVVVQPGIQGISTRVYLVLGPGEGTKELKKPFVLYQAGLLEGFGHIVHICIGDRLRLKSTVRLLDLFLPVLKYILRQGNGARHFLFVQSQNIHCGHPSTAGEYY